MNTSKNFEADLIAALRRIEEQAPVDQLIYENKYLWPMLKVKIYFDNWAAYNSGDRAQATVSFKKRIFDYVKFGLQFVFKDLKNMRFLQKCDVLFFADPFNRRVVVDGKKFEIYLDPIVKQVEGLNRQALVVERNAVDRYQIPRFSKSVPQFILQMFFSPVLLKKTALSVEFIAALTAVKAELIKSGLSAAAIEEKRVYRYLSIFNLHYSMYRFVLRFCRPKYVVLTEWYSIISMAMILACKKAGIKAFDVQHGVQSEAHIAYGNFMKAVPAQIENPFPDFFWVWTTADKENIEKSFSRYGSRSFLGGNLFLKQVAESKITLKDEELLNPVVQSADQKNKKICVVTLQPTYELHPLILEFLEKHQSQYFFLIRLHPIMMSQLNVFRESLNSRFKSLDFEMDLASKLPLVSLLKDADLHITFNSSTVLEAESFGVPSYVFDHDLAQEYFKAQIKSGICQIYGNTEKPFRVSTESAKTQTLESFEKLF